MWLKRSRIMKEFHLQIVTPDGIRFDGDAQSLLIKCEMGDIEVLAGHTDYFSSLGIGRARIKTAEGARMASAAGGFLSVSGGEVKVVATTFEYADEIDVSRARASKERAEEKIKDAKDAAELEAAKLKLMRALNRIKVAELNQ